MTKPRQERDGPTKEQAAKHRYEPVYAEKGGKGERHKVQTVRTVPTLETMYRRKILSQRQYLAAAEITRLREEGWANHGLCGSYGQYGGGGDGWSHLPSTEAQVEYRKRFDLAKDAVYKRHWVWVERIIMEGSTAAKWASIMGGSASVASGIIMERVRDGLEDLADHFGIR